jgi:hypothetical protein
VVPPEYTAVATLGGIKLDMRDATFAEAETTIKAVAVMGGIEVKRAPARQSPKGESPKGELPSSG